MKIEHTFRDFNTHLGLRGLDLRVHVAERTGRLLLPFSLAYVLAIALAGGSEAAPAGRDLEILRRRPRHGTRRTLSVLSLAMQMLAHPRWRRRAFTGLRRLIVRLARGLPALRHPPPDPDDRLVLA